LETKIVFGDCFRVQYGVARMPLTETQRHKDEEGKQKPYARRDAKMRKENRSHMHAETQRREDEE